MEFKNSFRREERPDEFGSFRNAEITPEANIIARRILGEDELRLQKLMSAPSLTEMHELSKELIIDADEKFAKAGVVVNIGKRALNNTLVRLWTAQNRNNLH